MFKSKKMNAGIFDGLSCFSSKSERYSKALAAFVNAIISSENLYFSRYIEDSEKMAFYDTCLKKVNKGTGAETFPV